MKSIFSDRAVSTIEWVLLIIGVAFCVTQLTLSWNLPILDQYAFRQTQTALSVYWIIKGGAWLGYPTPVLGAPWAIPFEFPLYQWIVAIIAGSQHVLTLDQSGRLVSEFFFLFCLWPLWRITNHDEQGDRLFRICAVLLLFSPIYVFWSRSFMIESTVLFFSLWFVAALMDYQCRPTVTGFVEMTVTAVIAAAIKITTFFGFSIAGALVVLWSIYSNKTWNGGLRWALKYVAISMAVIISLVVLWAWVHYSDILKNENILARSRTGEALTTWNFGTLAQRTSVQFLHVIFERAPDESLGSWVVPLLASVAILLRRSRKHIVIYFALLFAYLAPFLVFTNLHLIHHYYQYANAIFLVFAVGYALFSISTRFPVIALVLTFAAVSLEVYGYANYFHDDMTRPNRELQAILATYTRGHTDPDDVIAGFGLSWSSEVPYYSERRAIMVADDTQVGVLKQLASSPSKYTAGHRIGAVIVCPNQLAMKADTSDVYRSLLDSLIKGKSSAVVGYCVVYS